MQDSTKKRITSYEDLDVYRNTYSAAIKIHKAVIYKLPDHEKYDLIDQLRRSSKAIPRLIAEGYAKRHQKAGFQKYLDDALAECNETAVGLKQCRDIYNIECEELISIYDISAKQLYRLAEVWTTFKRAAPHFHAHLPPSNSLPNPKLQPSS
jgi:four helix bundle protein